MSYDFQQIEKKWREAWGKSDLFRSVKDNPKPKYYVLEMYPYPSGELHVGHFRNYVLGDVVARYKRINGHNVLHPMGWDSFGLPTENAAIKRGIHPSEWNEQCIRKMREQFELFGLSYDWSREINTADPNYYRWTQWLLLKFWEHGLLYQDYSEVNWCTGCQTVLANEQVVEGKCERCGSDVVEKRMKQWFLKITAYADRLLDDLKTLTEWPKHVLKMQKDWIGKTGPGIFKIRDWCISRQRYWGAPIPFVHCEKCGSQPVPEDQLPILLPPNVDFSPGWPPPLARDAEFVNTRCPVCGGKAKRDVNTADTFVFSSWYYYRFINPQCEDGLVDSEEEKYWMPVDQYVGGVEHATVHLIYARFVSKFLFDIGVSSTNEPFKKLFTQGMICYQGKKMSKSRGNVIDPVELMESFGVDALRLYILFLGPPEQEVEWNDKGVVGCRRMLVRVFDIFQLIKPFFQKDWGSRIKKKRLAKEDLKMRSITHRCIRNVTQNIEGNFHFHTAISGIMEWINLLEPYLSSNPNHVVASEALEVLTLLLSVFSPHIAEEIWEGLGNESSVLNAKWPQWEESLCEEDYQKIIIQVNGKLKKIVTMNKSWASDSSLVQEEAMKHIPLEGKEIKKVIFVPGKVINFVTA